MAACNALIGETMDGLRRLVREHRIRCQLARTGTYRGAATARGERYLARYRAFLEAAGLAFEELGARFSEQAVVLLEPATVYMALMLQDSATMKQMLSVGGTPSLAERLATAKLVLMPINDKDDPEAHSGGSHWSLLAFRVVASTGERRFEHYDSCAQSNRARPVKAASAHKSAATLRRELGTRLVTATPSSSMGRRWGCRLRCRADCRWEAPSSCILDMFRDALVNCVLFAVGGLLGRDDEL